ncbi:hypothetical protein ABPG74_013969 [Tetrahymena malaccensis]
MSTFQASQSQAQIVQPSTSLNPLQKNQKKLERGSSILMNATASSLIWKDKIKINEKDIEKLKSYNKKELKNLDYLIRLPHEHYELQRVASMSVEQKLLYNDQNDMNFYKIPNYDKKRAKQRNNTNFRTQHQISDKALLGESKLFQETQLTPYENQIRNLLKKKDQKNVLLLGEIYKKLEDSLDEEEQKLISHFNDRTSKQNDIKLVEGLDNWLKIQKTQQVEKEKKKGEHSKTGPINTPSQFIRRETIKRMSLTLPQIMKEDKPQIELSKFPQLVGLLKNDVTSPFAGTRSRQQTRQQEEFQQIDHEEDNTQKNSMNTPKTSEAHKSRFFDALHDALKTINEKEREKSNDPNVIYDKDRGLRKTIKNYMKKVPDVSEQGSKIKGEQVTNQEFTAEGMRQVIEDLFKIDDEEGISSVIDRARFYEKQAGLIESQLIQKIRDTISLINNKVNTARILRLENYQLLRKINQIKNLIKQLNEELNEQQNKASKNPNMAQSFFDMSGSSVKKKSQNTDTNLNSPSTNNLQTPQFNYNQSSISNLGNDKSTRQNLIDNLMTNVQKLNELEGEIQTLKNTLVQYDKKMKDNDKQIILIEDNINQKKKELKSLQKGKKLFLLELLKNGKDARGEGLSWIIRSIWNSQEKVFDSYLPDFLDQKAKEYLLQRSHKEDELQNMVSLLNMQLELYKANMMINDHMKDIEGLEIDEDQQEQSNINPSIMHESSLNPNQSISAGNILNKGNMLPNLSKIDVKRIKYEQSLKKKQEKIENIQDLIQGIESNQQDIVQRTLNELNTSKQTSNDIIYLQTQKKIKDVVRQARQQQLEQQLMKDKEKNENENLTLLNANQSIISPTDNNNINNNSKQQNNKIVLYENNSIINKYESREEFVKQYEQLCKKIEEKQKQIKFMEEEELMRIIREFDYKNYRKRMGVACSVVLCALFGCYKADKELIRHGMTRK